MGFPSALDICPFLSTFHHVESSISFVYDLTTNSKTNEMNMQQWLGGFWGLCLWVSMAPVQAQVFEDTAQRPLEKWIYRIDMEEKPGIIAMALHQRLWVAFDTINCDVYQTWQGGIKRPKGQTDYVKVGMLYHENLPDNTGWKLYYQGKLIETKATFDSLQLILGHPVLHYHFTLPDGKVAPLKESLSWAGTEKNPNRNGVTRTFYPDMLPDGVVIHLAVNQESMFLKRDLKTNNKFANYTQEKRMYRWGAVFDVAAEAILHPSKPTELTIMYTTDMDLEAQRRGK